MSTPQDDKPDNSSKKEPSRDGKAEQETRNEEYKQEAEQLLKFHRPDKILAPSVFLGILSVYLLFVAAVTALGVLASYSGHVTTLEITFFISIALLLIVPIGAIWYLRTFFRKQPAEKVAPGKQSLMVRFMQSSTGRAFITMIAFMVGIKLNMMVSTRNALFSKMCLKARGYMDLFADRKPEIQTMRCVFLSSTPKRENGKPTLPNLTVLR